MILTAIERIEKTPSCLQAVEKDLLRSTGGAEVAWVGRAATALYLAYRLVQRSTARIRGAEVILPATCCTTPANVAYQAGLVPRFADIEPDSGVLSLDSIQARWTERTRAVVFVHLFGQTADLALISKWCRSQGALLIEDAAQSLGARLTDGREVGSVGDMCVYSFNSTKILESGGGALTIRADALTGLLEDEVSSRSFPAELPPEIVAQLAMSYRNLHHGLVGLLRIHPEWPIADLFQHVRGAYDRLYVRPMKDPAALARDWERLPSILQHRRQLAEAYSGLLSQGPWRLLDGWCISGVCWRYSLLIDFPEQLIAFSESVRRDGFHVSNLYWPLHHFFRPEDHCPAAVEFARRIVNFWVDATVDLDTVTACAASALRHANGYCPP